MARRPGNKVALAALEGIARAIYDAVVISKQDYVIVIGLKKHFLLIH